MAGTASRPPAADENDQNDQNTEADREIVVSRTIAGPRRLVFEAYTDVRHLAHWWGPDGFSTTTRAFEFRPGGVWDFVMHGPDGAAYPNRIEWREIVPPERIVYLHGEGEDDPRAFVSTVTLVERGGATEITMRAVFPTREQRQEVVERYHAIEGGQRTLGRLAAYVATLTADGPGEGGLGTQSPEKNPLPLDPS